jgi:UDP-N-acetyl-D-glucosamine/UDP-N-acetyl-D-galactosamine dehydrogenase
MRELEKTKIAVVGLGYVGLPLAIAFSKKFSVIGYDISRDRIDELKKGYDRTRETLKDDLIATEKLIFTDKESDIATANVYILSLPTPVNEFNVPDFTALVAASNAVGRYVSEGDIIIYESTVYPGATREICVDAIEKTSGLKFNKDFFIGYSPERISPADKLKLADIVKVTSGSTEETANFVDALYKEIIKAGTFRASSLEVAEACKVIENAQRDINIGFMNEVAILMNKLNIDTKEVTDAMKTKWNALSFVPGLVGGHCIGVDPYYLVHKAQSVGHNMGILRATRTINDEMGFYVANEIVRLMAQNNVGVPGSRALLMGITFKENCPDIRNARPLDIKKELEKYNVIVDVYDPVADHGEVKKIFNMDVVENPKENYYDSIVIAVMHSQFRELGIEKIKSFGKANSVVYDLKSIYGKNETQGRL